MSILLSIFMAALAIGGMWNHSDWRYWVSCWAVCALFMLSSAIRDLVRCIGEQNHDK